MLAWCRSRRPSWTVRLVIRLEGIGPAVSNEIFSILPLLVCLLYLLSPSDPLCWSPNTLLELCSKESKTEVLWVHGPHRQTKPTW